MTDAKRLADRIEGMLLGTDRTEIVAHFTVADWKAIVAALSAQDGVVVPKELYDSCGIYVELGINSDIRSQQVDAVLHAAIRLIRKNAAAEKEAK